MGVEDRETAKPSFSQYHSNPVKNPFHTTNYQHLRFAQGQVAFFFILL